MAEEEEERLEETLVKNVNLCRKEKRKMLKKLKRKQIRKEIAVKEKEEEEARLNDVKEHCKLELKEKEEAELMERQRKEFEEREKLWLEKAAKMAEEEEQRRIREEEEDKLRQVENDELSEDDGWEYVEEGPAEIIWQGNKIIVKKKTVRVPKKNNDQQQLVIENSAGVSSQGVFDSVAQETPNFGTEQEKANCPFHIKTVACRFGSRCSRVHYYPDKSCTLLIKNMYNGPGLAWEQDEGLEQTDEEVERCFEEFYEDSLESAILAYRSLNGRYFASKQITCEYVGVTKWKVAICGEYMRSRLTTCSCGTACNFIHCFRNPSGDYEWADWDKPPPIDWMKMDTTKHVVPESWGKLEGPERKTPKSDSSIRSRSRTINSSCSSHSGRQRDPRRSKSRRSSYEHRTHEEIFEDDQTERKVERGSVTLERRQIIPMTKEMKWNVTVSDRDRFDRKDNSSRRRDRSKERLEFTKSDNSNLSASPGRYDPSSKYSDNSSKRKHSKSREEETDSSEEDHYHEENKKAQGQKHRRDDHSEKKRMQNNKEDR
ncbi:hypothetical protein MKW92_051538, partial [Papaver armeniacum]